MNRKASIDYITRDYEGFRQLMIDLIPTLTPEWTDTSQSDLGIVLLELTAHGLDVLSYYLDKVFNEGTLATAQTRESVINICNMLGYSLSNQTPAVHQITLTRSPYYHSKRLIIPKWTKVGTDSSNGQQIVFETLEDIIFEPSEEQVESVQTVTVHHGETVRDLEIGKTTGKPSEAFKLTYPDVLLDTLVVTTQIGGTTTTWTVVEDFFNSTVDDRHITTSYDSSNNLTITFGDGIFGSKPIANSVIQAYYRVGGGIIGNVGVNTIVAFVEREVAGVSVNNPKPAIQVGTDIESLAHAKLHAPKAYRAMDRAITKDDFEGITSAVTGVAKAQCIETFNINGDLHIYVVPSDFEMPTDELKSLIMTKLESVKLVHDNPILLNPTYIPLFITVDVSTDITQSNQQLTTVIEQSLIEAFSVPYMDIGEGINRASIIREVMRQNGVHNVEVIEPITDITVGNGEVLKLENLTVNVTGGV